MSKYTVFFELYGKKMRTEVDAISEADAKAKIAEKIIFHKIEKQSEKSVGDQFDEILNNFINGLKKP